MFLLLTLVYRDLNKKETFYKNCFYFFEETFFIIKTETRVVTKEIENEKYTFKKRPAY